MRKIPLIKDSLGHHGIGGLQLHFDGRILGNLSTFAYITSSYAIQVRLRQATSCIKGARLGRNMSKYRGLVPAVLTLPAVDYFKWWVIPSFKHKSLPFLTFSISTKPRTTSKQVYMQIFYLFCSRAKFLECGRAD